MKNLLYTFGFLCVLIWSCQTKKSANSSSNEVIFAKKDSLNIASKSQKRLSDTIRIANDSLQYEVIIIDPGFSIWLNSRAFPRGYHSQNFLETKNLMYINEWNYRVNQPQQYNPNLYEMSINYEANINYGLEVNYLIYNYMVYFQNTYNQRLWGYVPPR